MYAHQLKNRFDSRMASALNYKFSGGTGAKANDLFGEPEENYPSVFAVEAAIELNGIADAYNESINTGE